MEHNKDYLLTHNEAGHRFELDINGTKAFIDYSLTNPELLIIAHTEVPKELEGKGIGSMLVEKMLNYVEEKGWKIIPLCPFTSAYIKRHPEREKVIYKRLD